MPELKLRQAANKRAELFVAFRRERRGSSGFHLIFGLRGIEFRGEESEEEVQEVDAEGVGDCGRSEANSRRE